MFERFNQLFIFLNNLIFFSYLLSLTPTRTPSPLPLSRLRERGVLEKSFSGSQFCYHPALSLPVQGGYFFQLCSTRSLPDREGNYFIALLHPCLSLHIQGRVRVFSLVSLQLLPSQFRELKILIINLYITLDQMLYL